MLLVRGDSSLIRHRRNRASLKSNARSAEPLESTLAIQRLLLLSSFGHALSVAVRMKSGRAAEAAAGKPGARRVDAYTVQCEVATHYDVVKWITGAGGE